MILEKSKISYICKEIRQIISQANPLNDEGHDIMTPAHART